MKPKSETMWMAWHPITKFITKTGSLSKAGCQLIIDVVMPSPDEYKPVKVQITEIPKKRGKA